MIKLIRSAKIEKEIMLRVGLRMIDSHEIEEVDMLLDSGATGLSIDCAWLCQKKITTRKWLHKHNPEVDWETGKVEMTRCPQECNVSERREKGIKKRTRAVGEEKSTKT